MDGKLAGKIIPRMGGEVKPIAVRPVRVRFRRRSLVEAGKAPLVVIQGNSGTLIRMCSWIWHAVEYVVYSGEFSLLG